MLPKYTVSKMYSHMLIYFPVLFSEPKKRPFQSIYWFLGIKPFFIMPCQSLQMFDWRIYHKGLIHLSVCVCAPSIWAVWSCSETPMSWSKSTLRCQADQLMGKSLDWMSVHSQLTARSILISASTTPSLSVNVVALLVITTLCVGVLRVEA